ncbi:uncharacterized protein LOC100117670 isoform X2 [Nasonia vitripennis]|uniref:Spaetzle domain-containing protein n=1 Tax=Nasonia vitripennis TaxID=7425 RepID=A0A7M7QTB6_NASVI|nr:uncharacterized protein LOC100117670 isoform X2 [Nasonia vitripennis]
MTSPHLDMADKRTEIDLEVLNFEFRPQIQRVIVDGCGVHVSIQNDTRPLLLTCVHLLSLIHFQVNVTKPQEGISTDDEGHYLIVNIPSLQQPIQFVECLGGKSKSCEVEGDSTCQQAYREEPFLTLPADVDRYYEARDFKIKKFRIPNGCQCGEGVDLVVSLD